MRIVSDIIDEELSGYEIKRLINALSEAGFNTEFLSKGDISQSFGIRITKKDGNKIHLKNK